MEKAKRNGVLNITATVSTVLLIALFIYLTVVMGHNQRLDDNLKKEKLASERLLSEKLLSDKEVAKLKAGYSSLEGEYKVLDAKLNVANQTIANNDQIILKARQQTNVISVLRNRINQLEGEKRFLNEQAFNDKKQLAALKDEKDSAITSISFLQRDLMEDDEELQRLKLTSFNEIQVVSEKKNSRLTTKAARAKFMIVKLNVSELADRLNFVVVDPQGRKLLVDQNNCNIKTTSNKKTERHAFYDANGNSAPLINYKAIEIEYRIPEQLIPGIYNLEVLSNEISLAKLFLKLN